MELELLTPNWNKEYELIDTGDGKKLERFGSVVLSRPEPQALWDMSLSQEEWDSRSDAIFSRSKGSGNLGSDDRGEWFIKPGTTEQWWIEYVSLGLKFRLGLTAFKHVGIFPEQAVNWDFIHSRSIEGHKVLNLFAYTGGASIAGAITGANVTHVDSVKQTVTWSRENMERTGLTDIRWVVEDAMKYVKREVRRGVKYSGIILDPPSYGRGTNGEKWVLMDNIKEMLEQCSLLLEEDGFFVLNLYSMGLSALLAETLVRSIFPQIRCREVERGELYLDDSFGKRLPLGVFVRF